MRKPQGALRHPGHMGLVGHDGNTQAALLPPYPACAALRGAGTISHGQRALVSSWGFGSWDAVCQVLRSLTFAPMLAEWAPGPSLDVAAVGRGFERHSD